MLDDKTVSMPFRESQPRIQEVAVIIHRANFALDAENTRPIIIGRESENGDSPVDIDLGPHGGFRMGVSRQHLELQLKNNSWTITDLGSRNRTALSGIILEPFIPYIIPAETRIILGNLVLRLYVD
jgi:pSer/pThr/pTyr-binding forkhead associated (FHA) protein